MSNSVFFAASQPVSSLRQAVVRLGLKQCRNLILTSSAASLMKSMPLEQEWVREVIWQHSFRTAKVCSYLNKSMRMGFEGEEFTAGLLHDFGRLLLAVAAPESFSKADSLSFDESGEFLSRENEVLGIEHCAFGAWFAAHNGLPRARADAMGADAESIVTDDESSSVTTREDSLPDVAAIGIGVSTGGPQALSTLLAELPQQFPVPILIAQHMPPVFTGLLAQRLSAQTGHEIREVRDGDLLTAGTILIAPGDHHLTVVRQKDSYIARRTLCFAPLPIALPSERWGSS